jgi:hypothetical protein
MNGYHGIYKWILLVLSFRQSKLMSLLLSANSQITLVNLSQLLGYTKVVIPQYSIIVAPQGASDSLLSLLKTFNRLDILQYQDRSGKFLRYIAVARWDENSQCIDYGSIIPANYM